MRVIRVLAILSLLIATGNVWAGEINAGRIGGIVGVEATKKDDGTVRVGWPRNEVQVEVDGLKMNPFMGLGSWAAFHPTQEGAMVMGDTVVFQDEVNPAIDAAFDAGLEITALHNHFFYDEPKVYFMHIGGSGDSEQLAQGVKMIWDAIKKVRDEHPKPQMRFSGPVPEIQKLDTQKIEKILGHKGKKQDNIFKVSVGRSATMNGIQFGGSMGLSSWMAFGGSNDYAAVDGDFAMKADEVQAVLKTLRSGDINIVALHNHMLGEEPAYYFTHFWGKGKVEQLAKTLREALDVLN